MRKGELNKAAIDRGWPHQVAIPASDVVGAGFHPRMDFAGSMSVCRRWHTVRRGDSRYIVLCFAEKADAERFIERVGGEYMTPKTRSR
jgi:hypothetical protein